MSNSYHLPNADQIVVEREKITEYLLNPAHPDGAGKALFFTAHGFRREDWETLAAGLRTLVQTVPVSKIWHRRMAKSILLMARCIRTTVRQL